MVVLQARGLLFRIETYSLLSRLDQNMSEHENFEIPSGRNTRLDTMWKGILRMKKLKMCPTEKFDALVAKLKRARKKKAHNEEGQTKLMIAIVREFLAEFARYGDDDGEKELCKAVYRYVRHQWNEGEEKNGEDLLHEAFSLKKVMDHEEISENDAYALIYSLFQNKKTFINIGVTAVYLSAGYSNLTITSSGKQGVQTYERYRKEFAHIREVMLDQGFRSEELEMFDDVLFQTTDETPARLRTEIKKRQVSAMRGDIVRCVIIIKESSQLRPLRLAALDGNAMILGSIDEGHKNSGYKYLTDVDSKQVDEDVKWDVEVFNLRKNTPAVKKMIVTTATPSVILHLEASLFSDNVFHKRRNPGLRAHEMLECHADMPKPGNKVALNQAIIDTVERLSTTPPVERYHEKEMITSFHPHIVLAHTHRTLEDMKGLYTSFRIDNGVMPRKVLKAGWVVMTYFGEGLRLRHRNLVNETVEVNGVLSVDDMGIGEHFFPRGVEVADILNWLGNNGGVETFPRIIIFSYDMAGEGVSFSDHRAPYWHVNRIMVCGDHPSSLLAQIVARLFGCHWDNMKLHAHLSKVNKERFFKEVTLIHDEIMPIITTASSVANTSVPQLLQEHEFYSNRVPSKYLATIKKVDRSMDIQTVANPAQTAENKMVRDTTSGIDICRNLHPDAYKKIKKQMDKRKKSTEESDTDKRKKASEDAGMHMVLRSSLTGPRCVLYDRVTAYLGYGSSWVGRTEVVDHLVEEHGCLLHPTRGRLCELATKNGTVVTTFTTPGLYFRKKDGLWELLLK